MFEAWLQELAERLAVETDRVAMERFVVERLDAAFAHFNWTGFYWLDPADASMLVLGAYVGAPTEHTRIPVERGICGAAVAQAQTILIDDVHSDPRYLACSLETKSEIVVPVWVDGKIVGEIDIDSHKAAAFGPEDRAFLERVAVLVGEYLQRTRL